MKLNNGIIAKELPFSIETAPITDETYQDIQRQAIQRFNDRLDLIAAKLWEKHSGINKVTIGMTWEVCKCQALDQIRQEMEKDED